MSLLPSDLEASAAAWLATLLDATLKSLPVLAMALLAALVLRRGSASTRHLTSTLAVVALLVLPVISAASPGRASRPGGPIEPPLRLNPISYVATDREVPPDTLAQKPEFASPLSSTVEVAPSRVGSAPPRSASGETPTSRAGWLTSIWAIVACSTLAPWLVGLSLAWWRGRRATRVTSGPWFEEVRAIRASYGMRRQVDLRVGPAGSMPATWGYFRPLVILPSDAASWSPEALRSVLRHELAHAKRADFLAQGLSRSACALYWFNPLAWLLDRRLRGQAERASDDLALLDGARPSDYAADLIGVVRSLRPRAVPGVVAMARPGSLEGRIRAILEPGRDRTAVSRRRAVLLALATSVLLAPLGVVRLIPRAEARQVPSPSPAPTPAVDTPEQNPISSPAPDPTPDGPWRKTLPGGMTVELRGLQAVPTGPGDWWNPDGTSKVESPWWKPDGSPLDRTPMGRTRKSSDADAKEKLRQVAVRTSGVPDDSYYAWKTSPARLGGGGDGAGLPSDGLGTIHRLSFLFPNDLATSTIRLGIAAGPWKAECGTDGRGGTSTRKITESNDQVSIMFTKAREAERRTSIVVADTIGSEDQFRVVAIDRFGRPHTPDQSATTSDGKVRQQDQAFDLPLDQVARFELQRRAFAWAEFAGVALEPRPRPTVEPRPAPPTEGRRADRSRSPLQFRLVDGPAARPDEDDQFRPIGPRRAKPPTALKAEVFLDDADVARAEAVGWGSDGWDVRVTFTAEGARAFAELARRNPRRRLALVLDGKVLDASTIEPLREPPLYQDRPAGSDFATGRLDEFDAKSIASAIMDVKEPGVAHPRPAREVFQSRPRLTILGSQIEGHSLRFEEAGQLVAGLGHVDRETVGVQAWDVDSGRLLRTQPAPPGVTRGLASAPTQSAGLRRDGSIQIWQPSPTGKGFSIDAVIPTPHAKATRGAAFSPFDVFGTYLATWGVFHTPGGGDRQEIKVWEAQTGELLRAHGDLSVNALAFSPAGKVMASGGSDRRVTVWDSKSGQVLRTLPGHRGPILALAFSPDGRTMATGDMILEGRSESSAGRIGWKEVAGEVKLWEVSTGRLVRTFGGQHDGLGAVAIAPDGSKVAGATATTGVIRVWDASTGATLHSSAVPDVGVIDALFSPDGKTLATVGTEGVIRLWDVTP